VDDFEAAICSDEPDLATVAYVAEWFHANVPELADLVRAIAEAALRTRWVAELRAWGVGVELAERYNRNLLQYGGGIAAVLGISAGGGGILALAKAIPGAQPRDSVPFVANDTLATLLLALAIVAAIAALGLGILLCRAFGGRTRAEAEADLHLRRLIELRPESFAPAGRS